MNRAFYAQVEPQALQPSFAGIQASRTLGGRDQFLQSEDWTAFTARIEEDIQANQREEAAKQLALQQREFAELRSKYIMESAQSVSAFLREHRALTSLVKDALRPLQDCFGDTLLLLRVMDGEEEPSMLYASVMWSGALESARESLYRFDEQWWLHHCGRSGGSLIFDFELI